MRCAAHKSSPVRVPHIFDSNRQVLIDADPIAVDPAGDVGTLPRPRAVGWAGDGF